MASGDYVKTEFHNGAPPAINDTALNNNENKTKELDDSMLAAETTIASLVASEAVLTDFRAYDPTRAYAINDPTFYLGVPYKSLTAANTGNTPSTSPTHWEATGGGSIMKVKKLTGTTNSAQAGETALPHGLDSTKIISVSGLVFYSTGSAIHHGYTAGPGYDFNISIGTTQVLVINTAGNSANILSKPFVVLITYED